MDSLNFKTEYVEIGNYYVNKKTRVVVTSDKVIIENKGRFSNKSIEITKEEITNHYHDINKRDYVIRHGKGKDIRLNFENKCDNDCNNLIEISNNKILLENALDKMLRRN